MIPVVTSSVVLYKNDLSLLKKTIDCLLQSSDLTKIFLIDNSPSDEFKNLAIDSRIEYIHNPSNLGFGVGHNIAIKLAIKIGAKYHFIVNPDVFFSNDVLQIMIDKITNDSTIGMMMPQILNLDGSIQYLPKLLPSPLSILFRKLSGSENQFSKFIQKYELRFAPKGLLYDAPVLSGCFTLLNLKAIQEIGLYDDQYFLYFEDWDLSRRMHQKYKTIYFPNVSVYHSYQSGANNDFRLFMIFVKSAMKYFNKWGWFFDKEREQINNMALEQFEQHANLKN